MRCFNEAGAMMPRKTPSMGNEKRPTLKLQ